MVPTSSKIFALMVLLVLLPSVLSFELKAGEKVDIPAGSVIEDDLYATGSQIQMDGTVNGDLISAGGTLKISGETAEDVNAAGGEIEMSGIFRDDVRVAGGNIAFSGQVDDDLIMAGGEIIVKDGAAVGGDVMVFAGSASSQADVGGDVMINAGEVKLGGEIGGSVLINAGQIEILPGTVIKGDLNTTSTSKIKIADGVSVLGETNEKIVERKETPKNRVKSEVGKYLTAFILGALMILLFDGHVRNVSSRVFGMPMRSVLLGLIFLVAVPIAAIIFAVTIIGIPVAIILVVLYFVIIYASRIFVSVALGQKILGEGKKKVELLVTFALGLLVWSVLMLVPVVNVFVMLATVLLGSGALFVRAGKKKGRKSGE